MPRSRSKYDGVANTMHWQYNGMDIMYTGNVSGSSCKGAKYTIIIATSHCVLLQAGYAVERSTNVEYLKALAFRLEHGRWPGPSRLNKQVFSDADRGATTGSGTGSGTGKVTGRGSHG